MPRLALVALALTACSSGPRNETAPAEPAPLAAPAAASTPAPADAEPEPDAPSLDGAIAWLGVDAPIDLASLRGQLVILDFWTYCCINCMHVLPLLRELEDEFADQPLAVIGVHSAKFDGERDPQRIHAAMRRYGVHHPVAVDSEMAIWRRYGVTSWPTLVVIRPNGKVVGVAPGEPDGDFLRAAIRGVLADARADGSLAAAPVRKPPVLADSPGPLAYPGKVLALPDGGLAVADSGHHRILILERGGKLRHAIGSGLRGWADGSFAAAAFDDPQGLAASVDGRSLYVADTRNHVVRRLDLRARTVETVAGTGALGDGPLLADTPLPARATALRSPWDLALAPDGKRLYIALAGSHQLAVLELEHGKLRRLAGSGRESIDDGAAERASFSQPSGLSLQGGALYVADSEVSGLRAVSITDGFTRTLTGTGLFEFGDRDGPLAEARLQHPLHVLAVDRGSALLVADTYNHKLKRVDLKAGTITTFYTGAGELALHEPAGLTRERSGTIVVADTNASRLLRITADGRSASVLTLTGVPAPLIGAALPPPGAGAGPLTARIAVPEPLRAGPVDLKLRFVAPPGHELSAGSPFDLDIVLPPATRARTGFHGTADGGREQELGARLDLGADDDGKPGAALPGELVLEVRAVACDAQNHSYCAPLRNRFALTLSPSTGPMGQVAKASRKPAAQPASATLPLQLPPR